jgi:hypothetical protein
MGGAKKMHKNEGKVDYTEKSRIIFELSTGF